MRNSGFIILLLFVVPVFGQLDTSYTVVHDIDIQIDTALRNFVPAKEQTKLLVDPIKQEYQLQEYPVRMKRLKPKMPIYRIRMEKPPKPMRSYLSFGFGNYLGSSLEAGWVNEKTSKGLVGALLDFEGALNGPVDKQNSGQSSLGFDLFTSQYLKSHTFNGGIRYNRLGYGLYGYDTTMHSPERSEISRVYQTFGGFGELVSSDTNADVQSNIGLETYYLMGNRGQSEFKVDLTGSLDYYLDPYNSLGVLTNNYFSSIGDSSNSNTRYLVELAPYYSYFKKASRLRLDIGFKVVVENDTLTGMGGTHVYPNANFDLTLVRPPGLRVYGGITGGVQQNHLQGLTREVGYLNARQAIQNSNELLTLQLGAKTTFLKRFTFDAGVTHSSIQNLMVFTDDVTTYSSFSAVYDSGVSTKLSFYGELIYNYGDKSMFGLEMKFNNYDMSTLHHAFYRPTTEITLTGQHKLSDRVNVGLDFFFIDGLVGINSDPAAFATGTWLDPIVDLSVNAEFKINTRWHAWTNVNNVFNKQYSYYLQYPSKGTNFLLGLNYSL